MTDSQATDLITHTAQIITEQAAKLPPVGQALVASSGSLPPAFYDHMQQAAAHAKFQPRLQVQPVALPLLTRLKLVPHKLAVYYVSRLAEAQTKANESLLQALDALAGSIERENG
ncbi:MAG: hypothetical protein H6668_18365 [Ardenticatenaceae bacterium]|nr:hypothetical protein [Ardenticatenaceae bacterium]